MNTALGASKGLKPKPLEEIQHQSLNLALLQHMKDPLLLTVLLNAVVSTWSHSAVEDQEHCHDIMQSVTHRHVEEGTTFIYQCRPGDDCGGIADRMAGIMSGLFFALLSDRAFKINWPGFEQIFEPQTIPWAFDDGPADELFTSGIVNTLQGDCVPFTSHGEIAILDDRNAYTINHLATWQSLEPFQHVFYHSNRDPLIGLYQRVAEKHHWPTGDGDVLHSHYVAYRCLFNDIFTPSANFFSSQYKPLDGDAVSFQDIVSVVDDFDHVSLAYHHRIADHQLATDPEEALISDAEIHWLVELGEEHFAFSDQRMNLFFVTNSMNSARKVAAHEGIRNIYERVYSQDLSGGVHVNYEKTSPTEAFRQAMMDWWIMRQAHYLVCGGSGFCNMAAGTADESQVRVDSGTRRRLALGGVLYTGRTCSKGCGDSDAV